MRALILGVAVSFVLLATLAVASLSAPTAHASPWIQRSPTCNDLASHWNGLAAYTAENANSGKIKCFKDGAGPAP